MAQRINVRLNGSLGSASEEKWSVGLNYGFGGTTLSQADSQTAATAIANLLAASATPFGTLANGAGAGCSLDSVDVYGYAASGPAVSHGQGLLSPKRGFTGTTSAPPQTCSVITLLTNVPGRSSRGRIYWPQLAPTISAGLKSSTAAGHGAGLRALNITIEGALNTFGPWVLCVYSAKNDNLTTVSAFRSGDVLDTQRRRRDALAETYTVTAK